MTLRPTPMLLAFAALVVTTGCSAPPAAVSSADHLTVAFQSFREGEQSLVLIGEDNPNYQTYASRRDRNTSIKAAPDDRLRDLIDFAAGEGFFEHASSMSDPGDAGGGQAKAMIVIEADDEPYSMILAEGRPDANRVFTAVQIKVMEVFRDVPSMQVMEGSVDGATFFDMQQDQINRRANDVMRRGGR